MKALVTGGAGFLGSHLCERLLAEGADVVCMDSFLTGGPRNVEHLIDRPSFRIIECDLTGYVHVPDRLDLVLHFASAASPADYLRYPIETLRVGSVGTLHALGLAREKGARFVLASTSEVYGDPLEHPQRETYWGNVNPVGPRSVYDEAKRFAESLTTAYRHSRRTDTGIVRIFNTYGPRMRPFDGRAIPTFIRQALLGEPITVTGDGSQTRSICYVDDTVQGIMASSSKSSSPIEFIDRPTDDPRVRRPDTTLAAERLGWQARVPAREGLRRTIEWFATELKGYRRLTAAPA